MDNSCLDILPLGKKGLQPIDEKCLFAFSMGRLYEKQPVLFMTLSDPLLQLFVMDCGGEVMGLVVGLDELGSAD